MTNAMNMCSMNRSQAGSWQGSSSFCTCQISYMLRSFKRTPVTHISGVY